jgi:uncharacterized protein (UPF0335 family)
MRGEDALQAAVVGGSQQQRLYRIARRDGASIEDACAASGIGLAEAKLIEAEDAKNPPSDDAYELLGHNSKGANMAEDSSAEQLRLLVERVERLTEEKKGIADDIKDVFAEAKSRGFDVPALREVIKLRAIDKQKREEKQAIVETYGVQLGLF